MPFASCPPRCCRPGRCGGFTLSQLATVLAVLGVLALMALPGYRQHLERANRAAARTALAEVAERQERYRAQRSQYARTLSKLGWNSGTIYLYRDGTLSQIDAPDAIYQLRLEGRPASPACPPGGSPQSDGYTAVAEPVRTQAADTSCGSLCLSSAGARTAGGPRAGACWGG